MNGGRKHYKVKNDSINIIKRRIAVINLFIDTNIWLAMFHLSKDDLKELNRLVLSIQQICNTTRHKSPIYGLFTLSKR